jgi:hypothetical protein
MYMGMKLNPLMHRLLVPAPGVAEAEQGVEQIFRLAATLYVGYYRKAFLEFHGTNYIYVERLKSVVMSSLYQWQSIGDVQLWVLLIGGMHAVEVDKVFFVGLIRQLMQGLGIKSWEEVHTSASSFLWIEELLTSKFTELGAQVMAQFLKLTPS